MQVATKRPGPADSQGLSEDIGARIARKLHHRLKEVKKAAKKAKVFETQKVVKNLKKLRHSAQDVKEIRDVEAQLEKLKQIDHHRLANTAFRTKLNKNKKLSGNASVQVALSSEIAFNYLEHVDLASLEGRIRSRLLSSKILAQEVAETVRDLTSLLEPEGEPVTQGDGAVDIAKERSCKKRKISVEDNHDSSTEEDDFDGKAKEGRDDANHGERNSFEWESGDVEGDDGSGSEIDTDGRTNDDRTASVPARVTRPDASKTMSQFLPSLAVGFTRGDSDDSVWSDNELPSKEGSFRKNRRGQRARRSIWEKKYGKNANHRKKEREASHHAHHAQLQPGDQRRKAPAYSKIRRPLYGRDTEHRSQQHGPGRAEIPSDVGRTSVNAMPSIDETPLHPSWEAKKRLKSKQNTIVHAQGTKIKF